MPGTFTTPPIIGQAALLNLKPFVGGRQNDGKFREPFGPKCIDFDFGLEDFHSHEEKCREGLVLGTCGHLPFDSEVGEESIDSGAPEFERVDPFSMLISVMDQVSGDPADVGFFGTFSDMERAIWRT